MESSLYNVEEVMKKIDISKPEESRLIFTEEIFDWTDNYTETLQNDPESSAAVEARKAIANLWLSYANMEKDLRQWKKAVRVFDDALSDNIASQSPLIFISYAELCRARGKLSNAQKIYLKALSTEFSEHDIDKIWTSFLHTMRENGSPNLTMDQLYVAVSSQIGYEALRKPSASLLGATDASEQPELNEGTTTTDDIKSEEPAPKKMKLSSSDADESRDDSNNASLNDAEEKEDMDIQAGGSTVVEPTAVMDAASTQDSNEVETCNSAAVDTHDDASTDNTDAPKNKSMDAVEQSAPALPQLDTNLGDINDITGVSAETLLNDYKSRPTMLFMPLTAAHLKQAQSVPGSAFNALDKNLVSEVENFLGMSIAMMCEADRSSRDSHISRLLDVIEAMWLAQAVRELHFDRWFASVIDTQNREHVMLEGKSPADEIGRAKFNAEMRSFRIQCALRLDTLNCAVNYFLGTLLQEQLSILAAIPKFPYAHKDKQDISSNGEQEEEFSHLKQIVNAFLSVRLYSRAKAMHNIPPEAGSDMIDAAQERPDRYRGPINDQAPENELFSAKKKFRKKRRKIVDQNVSGMHRPAYYGESGNDVQRRVNSTSHAFVPDIVPASHNEHMSSQQPRRTPHHTPSQDAMGLPTVIKPASNLHKLAALLGKSAKGSK